MSGFGRLFVLSVFAGFLAAPAWAEDGPTNLDAGKSPAQLFASDCAICHKSAQGLAKGGGLMGVESFLRAHYTASKESAAALANYLNAVGSGAPPPAQRAKAKQAPKGDAKKPGTEPAKPGDAKAAEPKPASDVKPAEAKPADSKPAEPAAKPADKPAETKSE